MGEYIGEVSWCNSLRMEINTDKPLHNGDGLCFLNENEELVGIRADVVNGNRVSCNRPHGAQRGAKVYRNYDIEWQRQVEGSTGNRKMDIGLTLAETETGYRLSARCGGDAWNASANRTEQGGTRGVPAEVELQCEKIPANNPEKATENIRKKALQWGDTVFNPVSLELQFSQTYLIPASLISEMKRELVAKLETELIDSHCDSRPRMEAIAVSSQKVENTDPDAIPEHLMTCHHCIRYANGMCSRETGQNADRLYLCNGERLLSLEFDCRNCLMYVCTSQQ